MKRHITASAALLVFSLLLVTCTASQYECTDPLGCLEISPGSPVIIGAIVATSGEMNLIGTKSLQAVEKTLADKDELLGHPLHLEKYGTDCTEESARIAATEFATYPDLSAAIGPTCSVEAKVAFSIMSYAGIPLVGPVPDPMAASDLTSRILSAIEHVAVQTTNKILFIPRQALLDELGLSP